MSRLLDLELHKNSLLLYGNKVSRSHSLLWMSEHDSLLLASPCIKRGGKKQHTSLSEGIPKEDGSYIQVINATLL